jgi:hypothetical protein
MASADALLRWEWDESEERMKPVINFIHLIPLEQSKTLLHCAQSSCWCSPTPGKENAQIINHHSACPAPIGWVLIGELCNG